MKTGEMVLEVPIRSVRPYPGQPRKTFIDDDTRMLARSIELLGQQSPVLVRRAINSTSEYELIDGERRLRAMAMLGRSTIKVLVQHVRDGDDHYIKAVVTNFARRELTPLETAHTVTRVYEMPAHAGMLPTARLAAVAAAFGRSPAWVSHQLKLNGAPEALKGLVRDKRLRPQTAVDLVGLKEADQTRISTQAVEAGLSHEQAKKLVNDARELARPRAKQGVARTPESRAQDMQAHDARTLELRILRALNHIDALFEVRPQYLREAFEKDAASRKRMISKINNCLEWLEMLKRKLEEIDG
jgi:ParB family chromosome partitioning protein